MFLRITCSPENLSLLFAYNSSFSTHNTKSKGCDLRTPYKHTYNTILDWNLWKDSLRKFFDDKVCNILASIFQYWKIDKLIVLSKCCHLPLIHKSSKFQVWIKGSKFSDHKVEILFDNTIDVLFEITLQ